MRVLQLNLQHCEVTQDLLLQTVRELKPDLAILSEPYRHLDTKPWVPDGTGKAAIWSCGKFSFQDTVDQNKRGFVRLKLNGVHYYSCYAPPSLTIGEFENFLDRLLRDAKGRSPVAIAGDFNAWAVEWGSKKTNQRGQVLLEAMSLLDVVLLNTGSVPTFVKGEASYIVDLTFVSSSLVRSSWTVSDVYTHSDHQTIVWEINTDPKRRPKPPTTNSRGWRVKLFDADLFCEALNTGRLKDGDTATKVEDVMRRVTEACDATIPRKKN